MCLLQASRAQDPCLFRVPGTWTRPKNINSGGSPSPHQLKVLPFAAHPPRCSTAPKTYAVSPRMVKPPDGEPYPRPSPNHKAKITGAVDFYRFFFCCRRGQCDRSFFFFCFFLFGFFFFFF